MELRRRVHELGTELGYPIWVAEHAAPELDRRSREFVQAECLRRARAAARFVCILDGSYGAAWNDADLCVLELEIFTAALSGRPFHLFLLAPYESDPRTRSLLDAVRRMRPELGDEDLVPLSTDEILTRLLTRIQRGRRRASDRRGRSGVCWMSSFPDLDVRFLDGTLAPLRDGEAPDPNLVRGLLSRAGEAPDEPTRLIYAWMAVRHLCAAPYSDPRWAHLLPLWDATLSLWGSAAAWYGLHGPHALGRLAAVNTLLWIRSRGSYEVGGGATSAQGTRGARASEFYSMAKMEAYRPYRRRLLERALREVDHALAQGQPDPSGLHAIRGSVLHLLGRRFTSLREYELMLRHRLAARDTEERIGEAEVELGMGQARVGRLWAAIENVQRGVSRLERSRRTEFLVRALRKRLGCSYFSYAGARQLGALIERTSSRWRAR